jgi:cytochrome oxidase assembly protein ShyY1
VVTLLLLPALIALGIWQLQRMREKEVLFAAYAAGGGEAVRFESLPADARFQHVSAAGRYESAQQILLDNMTHEGRAGFQVLTPLRLDSGGTVLVNRGWVPLGTTREILPDVSVGDAPRLVRGRLGELPRAGVKLPAAESATWPRVMSYPDIDEVRAALGNVAARVIQLDAAEPDGFVRDWHPATFPPERHLGYAITWFAMAAALLGCYFAVNLRRLQA